VSVVIILRLRGRFLCVIRGRTNLYGYPTMPVEIHQLRTKLQAFCDDLVGTSHTQDLRRAPGIVFRQDLRCITLPVLQSFKCEWEKCLLSWPSDPALAFHGLLLSPLLSTDAPSFSSLPLMSHGSFSSPPPIFHSSGSVLLCLRPSLALPRCPYDSHGLASPSAPLTSYASPSLAWTLLLLLQAETPRSVFPPRTPLTGAPARR